MNINGQIIIAEDQFLNMQILKSQIQEINVPSQNVTYCVNGQLAIDNVTLLLEHGIAQGVASPVALMVLDFQMPVKNGIQVVEEVKKLYEDKQYENPGLGLQLPKFVFLTAYRNKAFKMHMQNLGVESIYEKPIEIGQLREILGSVVSQIKDQFNGDTFGETPH